jgi:chromosome segregation ATPase
VLGGAWAIIVILVGALYSGVTSSISDLHQDVSNLSKAFNQANVSANSVAGAIRDASDALKLWRETHDQLIGVAIPELKQHTGQLNDIQSTLNGIVTTLGSVKENQNNMATDLRHVRSDLNEVRQKLVLPIRPEDLR